MSVVIRPGTRPGSYIRPDAKADDNAVIGGAVTYRHGDLAVQAQLDAAGIDTFCAVIADGVVLGPGTRVRPNAVIGPGAVIGANVTLHEQARVGAGAKIGDGVRLHWQASVDDGAKIGTYARLLAFAVVGKGAEIGPYVTLAEGAIVGKDGVVPTSIYVATMTLQGPSRPILTVYRRRDGQLRCAAGTFDGTADEARRALTDAEARDLDNLTRQIPELPNVNDQRTP